MITKHETALSTRQGATAAWWQNLELTEARTEYSTQQFANKIQMFEMFLQQHCPWKGVCVSLCDVDLTFISLST